MNKLISIGNVAKLLSVLISTLRRWERIGKLILERAQGNTSCRVLHDRDVDAAVNLLDSRFHSSHQPIFHSREDFRLSNTLQDSLALCGEDTSWSKIALYLTDIKSNVSL
jgi:hypothetical protein